MTENDFDVVFWHFLALLQTQERLSDGHFRSVDQMSVCLSVWMDVCVSKYFKVELLPHLLR